MRNPTPKKRQSQTNERALLAELDKRKKSVRGLAKELESIELKNSDLRTQVQKNENILSIIEEKNGENKAFLSRLQDAVKSQKKVTFDITDPFIKHYYRKLQKLNPDTQFKEEMQKDSQRTDGKLKPRKRSVDSVDNQTVSDQLRIENEFMLKVISKDMSNPLPSHFKCWARRE